MQILHFTVTGQNIHTETQDVLVVEGSRRYVFAAFALDDAWDGLTVCALFENDSLHSDAVKKIITQEPVEVPPEVLVTGRLRIGLVGLADDGAVRLTTKRMFDAIPVYQSGGTGGEDAQTVTPELWEQSLSAIGTLSELETENKSNLVAAINEARRMGAGDSAGYTPVKGTDYFTDAEKQEIAEAAAEMVSIPTALPNPNALTFTGAATGSYDGSAPLSVEIPGGGSGNNDWELLADVTLTEDVATIAITQTPSGEAFSVRELVIIGTPISDGTNKTVQFAPYATEIKYGVELVSLGEVLSSTDGGTSYLSALIQVLPEVVYSRTQYNQYDNSNVGYANKLNASRLRNEANVSYAKNGDPITKFAIGVWSGGTAGVFRAGTKMRVYGR